MKNNPLDVVFEQLDERIGAVTEESVVILSQSNKEIEFYEVKNS